MSSPPDTAPVDSPRIGWYVSWEGGCMFIGAGRGIVPVHAHYAIQIVLGDDASVRLAAGEDARWSEYEGAIVASRQPHGLDVTRVSAWAVLFVEPETREGRALAERFRDDGIVAIPDALVADIRTELFAAWHERHDRDAIIDVAQRAVRAIAGGLEARSASDPRILRAITYIRTHLDTPLTLESVAEEACLSPSRFRHLFVEETGMALRPYILWRRFLQVWELVAAGESLSAAAHGAGFADAAHLTRTSRRMFGFPPSLMQLSVPPRKSALSFK